MAIQFDYMGKLAFVAGGGAWQSLMATRPA